MQIKLGNTIKELRKRDGRTQEDMANALGVTAQAISRWETGVCYPDVELIPAVSNYFAVSIDELFGYNNEREKRIDELCANIYSMNRENNGIDICTEKCIACAREAVAEFPTSEKLLLCLANVLYNAGYVRGGEHHITDSYGYDIMDISRHRQYSEWAEAIKLYEKVLAVTNDGKLRNTAVRYLSQLYHVTGEYDKAKMLCENAPDIFGSRAYLRFTSCDGKEKAKVFAETLMEMMHFVSDLIVDTVSVNYCTLDICETVELIKSAIDVFHNVCSEGDYGLHSAHVARVYLYLSRNQWSAGDRDGAFSSLENALECARVYESFDCNRNIKYSSSLLKEASVNPDGMPTKGFAKGLSEDWPWIVIPDYDKTEREMKADPRWAEWVEKTKS